MVNGVKVSDGQSTVNAFNECFVNLGPNLAAKIVNNNDTQATDYLGNRIVHSMFVTPVTEEETVNVIKGLKNNSSPGWDGIKTSLLKEVCNVISKPLTYIINLSLEKGIVPDELKIARVVPIFKGGDRKEQTNYRPVSVLPCMSKIFEKLVYNRLIDFINKHNILSECQFGFRKGHCTDLAITLLLDKITKAIDMGDYFVGIFIDLSKAFDTVNHDILLQKIEHYGIRGKIFHWIKNYLTNRKQFVEYNNHKSTMQNISCGVPQGSILGPLLFLLYINDLPQVSSQLSTIMFADDTNMFMQHSDLKFLEHTVNMQLEQVVKWLSINKLSLNVKKTHVMLFTKKHVIANESALNIMIGKEVVQLVMKTKFLGVIVDQKLTWQDHINMLCNKIAKGIGILKKVKHKLDRKTLINLYYTFIFPYLTYCNIIWGNAAKVHINRLLVLQKRTLRLIYNVDVRQSSKQLFHNANIMNVYELNIYSICMFMFKHWKGLLPSSFVNVFKRRFMVHTCNTRSSHTYELILCRTETRKKSISYNGPIVFNKLLKSELIDISCINSIYYFKYLMKKHIQQLCDLF